MSEKTCIMCLRLPGAVNNRHSECSVADCPHRRHCWSDGLDDIHYLRIDDSGGVTPVDSADQIDRLFDDARA